MERGRKQEHEKMVKRRAKEYKKVRKKCEWEKGSRK